MLAPSGARREIIFESVMALEGVDDTGSHHKDPSDTGGWTQWGISLRNHPEVASELRNGTLTKGQAQRIFEKDYLDRIAGVDTIPLAIAVLVADAYFHGSPSYTVSIVQKVLSRTDGQLVLDGVWGPKTAAAAAKLDFMSQLAIITGVYLSADAAGQRIARAVMNKQRSLGLPSSNYAAGFANRIRRRASEALSLA